MRSDFVAACCAALLFLGCGGSQKTWTTTPDDSPARNTERWAHELGTTANNWGVCVDLGVKLRRECGLSAECKEAATRELSLTCYVGVYRADPVETLSQKSPCFWADHVDAASATKFVGDYCAGRGFSEADAVHCRAELTLITGDICTSGSPALTGVGL